MSDVSTMSTDAGNDPAGNADPLESVFKDSAKSAQPEPKPAGGGDSGKGEDAGGGAKLAPWADQLPDELKGNPDAVKSFSRFQKIGDMAKAYLQLEGKAAGALTVPGEDAEPGEAEAFWKAAGRPESKEGYSFAKQQGGEVLADMAFKANLTEAQAKTLFQDFEKIGNVRLEEAQRAQNRQYRETSAKLREEYGAKFPEKLECLKRGLMYAGAGASQALREAGLAGHPEIVRAFIALGELTAEGVSAKGRSSGGGIKSIMEGGSFSYE
jgi:hypothetical protein